MARIIELSSVMFLVSVFTLSAIAQNSYTPGMQSSATQSSSSSAALTGPPAPLVSAPVLPSLPGYMNAATFVSGHNFPSSQTGPIYTLFLSSALAPATALNNFQSLLSGNGWTVNTSQAASGILTGTLSNLTCQIQVMNAIGRDRSRIYINYQANTTPAVTTPTMTVPTVPAQ